MPFFSARSDFWGIISNNNTPYLLSLYSIDPLVKLGKVPWRY